VPSASPRPRVAILQRRLVAYRVGLFERLRDECDKAGIELRVVYGQPSPLDATRNDSAHLAWADEVHSRWLTVAGTELLWQPCPREVRHCDLVILTQESRILSNYPFLLARLLARLPGGRRGGRRRLASWGHGRNLQSTSPDGWRERWKGVFVNRVDWWFAYTGHTRDILTGQGFPPSRITCLDNAIDNDAFVADLAAAGRRQLDELRCLIDLAPGAPLGLYCGALYPDKRVDLMVAVADRVHDADPSFRLVVIGDGPDRPELERLVAAKPWARWVGALGGVDKAAWFRLATVLLSPGAVGLHVLDSFASGVPLFTTANARHGPEIDYLEHGRNGFVTDDDPDLMARAVLDLLADPSRLASVAAAATDAAGRLTLGNMTANFVAGILQCLATPL
jgi:glycosyltransferase involved in cell wall biosynthesis